MPQSRSQNAAQQAELLQLGNADAETHMLPAAQSLMKPHGSPSGMSEVVDTQLKPSPVQKQPSSRLHSGASGLQFSTQNASEPLLPCRHENPGSQTGASVVPSQKAVHVPTCWPIMSTTSQQAESWPQSSVASTTPP